MAAEKKKRRRVSVTDHILSALGILACVILIPILVINCTLLLKGYTTDEVPSFGGIFPMIVLSDSMYPVFASGDLIICRTAEPQEVEVGDVISFFDPMGSGTSVVSHRVIEITKEDGTLYFTTKGDYNNAADSMAVPQENLIGVYTGIHLAGVGNAAIFMQTVPGLIVCVVIPVLLLMGYDVVRRGLYEKKHSSEKEELLAELEELRRLKAQKESGRARPRNAYREEYPEYGEEEAYSWDGYGEEAPEYADEESYPWDGYGEEYPEYADEEAYPEDGYGGEYPEYGDEETYPEDGYGGEYPEYGEEEAYSWDGYGEEAPEYGDEEAYSRDRYEDG